MKEYTIYCTEEQTRKAFELGAPINLYRQKITPLSVEVHDDKYALPITAEQMIGWLRKEKGLFVEPYLNGECSYSFSPIVSTKEDGEIIRCEAEDSPEEATLAAIDAALDYLIKNK